MPLSAPRSYEGSGAGGERAETNQENEKGHGPIRDVDRTESGAQEKNWDAIVSDREALLDKEDSEDGASGSSSSHGLGESSASTDPKTSESFQLDGASSRSKPESVSWKSLPRKDQLVILTFARFSEPLAQTSLMAYMFYQLKSFDSSLSDSTISSQAGILQASFSAAQFVTAVWWGRVADHIGRKTVLLIGLWGTCLSVLAFGFSRTFVQAVFFRVLGGALNGNVGVMRTMVSEIVKEKKYQSRAFLLLPTFLNIGAILGPIMGGFFADPVNNLSWLFGPESIFGGKNGVEWMENWPYAFPNILSALILSVAAISVFLGLDESHETRKHRRDRGRQAWQFVAKKVFRRRSSYAYTALHRHDDLESPASINLDGSAATSTSSSSSSKPKPAKLPFRKIWTPKVVLSLLTHFFLIFNISTFNAVIFTFLPTPRAQPSDGGGSNFLHFTGGLGLAAPSVGLATALIGLIGLPLQLLLYPPLSSRLGTLRCYRVFLPLSAVACLLVPFLAVLPDKAWVVWPSLTVVLGLEVLARTLALPGSIIVINDSCPTPAALGTVHGVGQSVASGAKTVGPLLGGWGLGEGLKANVVGAVWWALGGVSLLGWGVAWFIREKKEEEEEEEEEDGEKPGA